MLTTAIFSLANMTKKSTVRAIYKKKLYFLVGLSLTDNKNNRNFLLILEFINLICNNPDII